MRKIVWAIISVGIILFVNWGAATLFSSRFIDWSFLAGLAVTIFIHFFNSSGGFMSDLTDARLQSTNNDSQWAATEVRTKLDRQKRSFHPTIAFYVALSYTVITGIITLIYYKDYLIH
ncbi:hypothetical protein OEV98_01785 [Caldibacillus lycopersici]|uniref:DUF3899 domain-containing protein n=1 Tax=Perspicuibacillus lycopersici TaxID=1325689 RepID=A0AAE3IPZ6_9BACI|nr:hypothetical protein [Perspicuibacillus lycopersici]MCU9612292.1 hypothetical protein [Perspicuibacillus lycopersici]